jgi:SET domain-containing protein
MVKPYLFIDNTERKGRGVYTSEAIPANTVVEVSPVIVIPAADRTHLDKTLLHDYIFEWQEGCCMALGYIPMYNHSYKSNCEYLMDYGDGTMLIKTVRPVKKGEELTINYNGDWNNGKKVWFDVQ